MPKQTQIKVLLLEDKISLGSPDILSIDLDTLFTIVANKILEMNSASDTDSPELQQQKKVKLESALKVLPKMQHGLDVNVRFTGVSAFEYTEEMTIFDALGIGLYHGWLLTHRIVTTLTFPPRAMTNWLKYSSRSRMMS